jgi:hypothetical protein
MDHYQLMNSFRLKTFCVVFAVLCLGLLTAQSQTASLKPRIIVLTDIAPNDIEPDDMESMIRLFVHADLFEIEGLVATTGWSNTGGLEHPELIHDAINAYEKDATNLMKRSGQKTFLSNELQQSIGYWPSPAYLREHTAVGSRKMGIQFIGAENKSPGSDLIIKTADEKDNRPIWILVWGGGNTLAQAIWQVHKERSPEQLKTFLHKLRVYTITDQDRPYASYEQGGRRSRYDFSAHYWMRKEFSKDLLFIWDESAWFYQNEAGKKNWEQYAAHIQNHGHLGKLYPKYKWGVEGDTPSFLYVLPNGLNDPEHPESGGWGGYFNFSISRDSITSAYTNYREIPATAISRKYEQRFYLAIFNNFAARMDWANDGVGNRNPVVIVNGHKDLAPIKLTPKTGSRVALDASASYDPDGDSLNFSWWVLEEAGSYKGQGLLKDSNSKRITLKIPEGSAGKNIHIICEVTDTGKHTLSSYKRIILAPRK